jgi:hypothetical protein
MWIAELIRTGRRRMPPGFDTFPQFGRLLASDALTN